jgi:hypothetical protein
MYQKKDWDANEKILITISIWNKETGRGESLSADFSKMRLETEDSKVEAESIALEEQGSNWPKNYNLLFPVKTNIKTFKLTGVVIKKPQQKVSLPDYIFNYVKTTDYQIYFHK